MENIDFKDRLQDEHIRLMDNIFITSNYIHTIFRKELKPLNLTISQANVLGILDSANKPLSREDVLKQMVEENSNITRIIDKLIKKELVLREFSSNDKRQIELSLTKKGLELTKEVKGVIIKMKGHLSKIPKDEALYISKSLEAFCKN